LPIFRSTMIGGTFFRLGTGAMPFLFPLMLQLAFGLNAFQTGTITFASAVGAFAAKFAAEKVLQIIGFRTAMIVTTAGTILGVVGMGLYTPQTPVWLMMTFLVLTGFVQSIFWTATNAFVFADVEDKDAGQANVMSQVGIQLSLAFGVALGGGALELFRLGHGGPSQLMDFHLSFYVIAAVGIISTLVFSRLPKNAGAHLSGHGAGGGGGH
jgi:MFS family permease